MSLRGSLCALSALVSLVYPGAALAAADDAPRASWRAAIEKLSERLLTGSSRETRRPAPSHDASSRDAIGLGPADALPISQSELVARLLAEARQREATPVRPAGAAGPPPLRVQGFSAVALDPGSRARFEDRRISFEAFAVLAAAARRSESLRQRAGREEDALWISKEIERLLSVAPYLTRRAMRQRQIRMADMDLGHQRDDALSAREQWLDILERLLSDPLLQDAVVQRMGEQRFLRAKDWIERGFKS